MSVTKILNVKEMFEELYFKNLLCVRQNSNSLCVSLHVILIPLYKVGISMIPSLQIMTKYGEVRRFVLGHINRGRDKIQSEVLH